MVDFRHRMKDFSPKLMDFSPKLMDFRHRMKDFSPKLMDFSPKLMDFRLRMKDFRRTPSVFRSLWRYWASQLAYLCVKTDRKQTENRPKTDRNMSA